MQDNLNFASEGSCEKKPKYYINIGMKEFESERYPLIYYNNNMDPVGLKFRSKSGDEYIIMDHKFRIQISYK